MLLNSQQTRARQFVLKELPACHQRPVNFEEVLNRLKKPPARYIFGNIMTSFSDTLLDSADGSLGITHPQKISFHEIARLSRLAEPVDRGLAAHGGFPREPHAVFDQFPYSFQGNLPRLDRHRIGVVG